MGVHDGPGSQEVRYDAKRLTGAEKAAITLLCLGSDQKSLWALLDDEEIKEISQAMSNLGSVPAHVVEDLLVTFVSELPGGGGVEGAIERTRRLLLTFLGPARADAILEEISGPAGRTMWDKLGNVNEAVLASYLKNERSDLLTALKMPEP